jgi:hypothetical protein
MAGCEHGNNFAFSVRVGILVPEQVLITQEGIFDSSEQR